MIITRRAPLVHAAHELAEEDLVRDARRRLVGARRVRLVVHRQEHARDRLREEGEHRGRAERVVPVGALRDLAVEEAAQERAGAGALVEPADDARGALDRLLLRRSASSPGPPLRPFLPLRSFWPGPRRAAAQGLRQGRQFMWSASTGRGTARARRGGSTGRAARSARAREFSEKRSPTSTRPLRDARVEAVERAHRRAALDLALEAVDAAVAGADELLRRLDVAHRAAEVGAAGGDRDVGLRVLALDDLVLASVELADVDRGLARVADLGDRCSITRGT